MWDHVLQQLPAWGALGAGTGGGFFIVKWFFEALFGRLSKRETDLDHSTAALIKGLEERVDKLTQRIDFVERGWRECLTKHAEAEAENFRLQAVLESRGEIRQAAARVVALDRVQQAGERQQQKDD